MSSISNLKDIYENIYMEGIASEHPDISGQKEFARKADEVLASRKKNRQKGKSPQLPSFLKTSKSIRKEEFVAEREMTSTEVKKEKKLKNKYDTSGMKASMKKQYGEKKGEQVYFATIRKQAMANSYELEGEELSEGIPALAAGALAAGALVGLGAQAARRSIESGKNAAKKGAKPSNPQGLAGAAYNLQKRNQMMQQLQSFDYDDAYEYIIETLIGSQFVENYESAEKMFEHMSDDFVATIVGEYIEEKARGTKKKSTVHAYDVDETLFAHGKGKKPNVQVHVKDESGKRVKSLSNQEFNTHKLEKGHSYDFSEFQSAKKFKETSTPNKRVVKDIKRKQARGQNVHLITARSKFDDPKEFHGHLKKHGINVPMGNIHYTGGMKGKDIGDKKVTVANAIAKKHKASKVHMYDDAAKVHKSFEKEKTKAPVTRKIKTHMVAPDKGGESRVRSYQATKNEEMTAYEYWKQFINEEKTPPKNDYGYRAGTAIKNTLKDLATGTAKDVKNLATTGRLQDTPERQRIRQRMGRVGEYLAPSAARSAEPSVRAGVRKPNTGFSHVQSMDKAPVPTKDSRSQSRPQPAPAKPVERKVISDKGGVNQKVTTNTAYKAKLGGREVTSTRGAGGQKMIRANLGSNSVQVKAGKAKAGKSYAATLGGVKGTVKYDTKGGKTFQALQKPTKAK